MGTDCRGWRPRAWLRVVILIAVVAAHAALVAGCADDDAPTPVSPQVEVVVDGTPVAHLRAGTIGARLDLTQVVPQEKRELASWVMLDVRARDGRRRLSLERPAARYPLQDFCLYVSPAGLPSFGVYRRDHPGLHPRLRELLAQPAPFLEDVERVALRTVETPLETRARELRGTLTLVVDGGTPHAIAPHSLDRVAAIETPPTATDPDDPTGRPGLWWLRGVIALEVDPDTVRSVRLVDLAGAVHPLAVESLREDAATRSALKRNRRGEHHVRLLEGERVTARIRDVVRIDLATR